MGALHHILVGLSGIFASFVDMAGMLAAIFGPIMGAVKLAEITRRNWLGWLLGPCLLVVTVYAYLPIHASLKRISCRGAADVQACIDGDDDEPDYRRP